MQRQQEVLEDEYQQQVVELEEDLDRMKKAIDNQKRMKNLFDRQTSDTIKKLKDENQRLNTKLKQAGEKERNMATRKQFINAQFLVKKNKHA